MCGARVFSSLSQQARLTCVERVRALVVLISVYMLNMSQSHFDNQNEYTLTVMAQYLDRSGSDWTEIKRKQLNVRYTNLFNPHGEESRTIYRQLEDQIEYLSDDLAKIKVFGRLHSIPRQQAGYGDSGVTYSYSNSTLLAKPWTPILKHIKENVERLCGGGLVFNFVLVNKYVNGKHYVSEHRDSKKELDPTAPIASVSIGASRRFYFKHCDWRKGDKSEPLVSLTMNDGMLLLMNPPTNDFWYHSLPIDKECLDSRINLTFRKILIEQQD